jgi:hypothetical protein
VKLAQDSRLCVSATIATKKDMHSQQKWPFGVCLFLHFGERADKAPLCNGCLEYGTAAKLKITMVYSMAMFCIQDIKRSF